jgi:hypothetical protein
MSTRKLVWAVLLTWLAVVPLARAQCPVPGEQEEEKPALNLIPEGTRFTVVLDTALESQKLKPGTRFRARLAENLMAPNGALLPRNSRIKGHVGSVDSGAHGRILLAFDSIQQGRRWIPLAATVLDLFDESGARLSQAGEVEKPNLSKKSAAAGTSTVNAMVTATGAITADQNLKLSQGQELELQLDRPLAVPKQ